MRLLYLLSIVLLCVACERDELPIDYIPPERVEGRVYRQVQIADDYRYQVYYDMSSDSVMATVSETDWDIAFACDPQDDMIRMNDGRYMIAFRVDGIPIEEVTSAGSAPQRFDESDGSSGAMDDWADGTPVYVLELGTATGQVGLGQVKMQVMEVTETDYIIRYAPLASDEISEAIIPKDPTRSYIQFSFSDGVVALEPPKEQWDLLFTQYTYFFTPEENPFGDFPIYYQVTGALLNPYNTSAQRLATVDFDAITENEVRSAVLSSEEDVIGYDWKSFTLQAELYTISDNAFAVQTSEGFLYKLQFTSFIDANGSRGAPEFQFEAVD